MYSLVPEPKNILPQWNLFVQKPVGSSTVGWRGLNVSRWWTRSRFQIHDVFVSCPGQQDALVFVFYASVWLCGRALFSSSVLSSTWSGSGPTGDGVPFMVCRGFTSQPHISTVDKLTSAFHCLVIFMDPTLSPTLVCVHDSAGLSSLSFGFTLLWSVSNV